jgi:hypothetical protein
MAETIINMVKIRARISLGGGAGGVVVETPGPNLTNGTVDGMIISFNVHTERAKPSTFSASLKVKYDVLNGNTIGDVHIEAGTESGGINTIFRGIVKNAKIAPCNDDPSYVMLSVSGSDVLSKLEGMKFTRRRRGTRVSWVSVDSVVRAGLRAGKFKYKTADSLDLLHTQDDEKSSTMRSASLQENFAQHPAQLKFDRKPSDNADMIVTSNPNISE